MPPPQCPECGRFLATAFVQQIQTTPAPCPRCGIELSLAEDEGGPAADAATPETSPPVPPPAATIPPETDDPGEPGEDAGDPDEDAGVSPAEIVEDAVAAAPPARPAAIPDDVEPEPETSVRPPDLQPARDPLEGWDESSTTTVTAEPDPVELAIGAGVGLLLGLLLGGRSHRGLGALLGAALGAVVARLRG